MSLYRLARLRPRCYAAAPIQRGQLSHERARRTEAGFRRLRREGHRPRRVGPHRDRHRRDRDAGPDGGARGIRPGAAAEGRAHRRLAAHDHPDRRADRDRSSRSAPRSAGPPATSSRPRTTPPSAIAARGIPVFAHKGETLAEYWDFADRIFEWPNGETANMILDDGGDATLLVLLGARAETDPSAARRSEERGGGRALPRHPPAARQEPRLVFQGEGEHPRRLGGDDHRRDAPLRDAEEGHAPLPGDQRQRQRHQVEVRQQIWLPREPGRRHPPRHRRDDGRQGRGRLRLWRCRQGLGAVAARRRRPRRRHRDRPDLRAAGGDGRF